MKTHTTNFKDTLIAVADDCPVTSGEVPPVKGDKKSIANIQFELIANQPYRLTYDDVVFGVYAARNDLTESELTEARELFFSKGQACLRTSPLTKRYGWGVHSDSDGKVAIYGCETAEYERLMQDKGVTVVKAMKSSR